MKNKLLIVWMICLSISSSVTAQITTDTITLETIEITDSIIKRTPFLCDQISRNQLLSVSVNDVGDYLRSVPNIGGIRKGGGAIDPVVRGFKFSQLNVVLDGGIKVENGCPNRMDPVSSHVEAEDIQKINVVKGPYLLNYGPSLGGAIDIQTEVPQPYQKFEVHANTVLGYESNWDGQKEHLSIDGGNKKIYFMVNGGYRKYGNYQSGSQNEESTVYKTSFEKYNYGAKVGFTITPQQNILLTYNGVHGRDVLYPALSMDEKSDDTKIMAIDYSAKKLSNTFNLLTLKIYRSDVHHVMDNSNRESWTSKQMVADVDAVNTGGIAETEMKFNHHHLFVGLDFENIYKDGIRTMTMQMMGTTSTKNYNLWQEASIQNAGIFARYSTLLKSFILDFAFRLDYNQADSKDTLKIIYNDIEYFNKLNSEFFNLSANMGITRNISENISVSLALASGTRNPNMLERYIKLLSVGYDNYDYLGNPQLKPETNYEADLTFKFNKENYGSLYLNGFYSYVNDYISAVMLPTAVVKPVTPGAPGVKQFVNVDYAIYTGFEMGFTTPQKYKLGGSIVAAFTYGYIPTVTKYILTGNEVTGDTLLKNDALPEIPPFETTVSAYYRFFKGKLLPKISFRYVSSQRHVSEAFYEPETPDFSLLNLSIVYKVNKAIGITAGINNVFDKSYYEHLNRKIIGTTEKLYEPGRVMYIQINIQI
jgi:iron complex outermembrane recepter protein